MAIEHTAFVIELDAYHSFLAAKIAKSMRIDNELLRSLAIEAARSPSVDAASALERFRFAPHWLAASDGEPGLWYMVVLAGSLRRIPSLSSNRFRGSWHILNVCLPLVGWDEEFKNELIFGKPLQMFVDEFREGLFGQRLRGIFGGYLDLANARRIAERFSQLRLSFENPTQVLIEAVNDFAGHNSMTPQEALRCAYRDAQDMLEAAFRHAKGIFLYMD